MCHCNMGCYAQIHFKCTTLGKWPNLSSNTSMNWFGILSGCWMLTLSNWDTPATILSWSLWTVIRAILWIMVMQSSGCKFSCTTLKFTTYFCLYFGFIVLTWHSSKDFTFAPFYITRVLFEDSRIFLDAYFIFNIFIEAPLSNRNAIGFPSTIISTLINSSITPFTLSLIMTLPTWSYSELLMLLLPYWHASTVWSCFFFEELYFTAKWFFPLHTKHILPNAGHNSLLRSCGNVQNLDVFPLLCVGIFSPGLRAQDYCKAFSDSLQMSMHLDISPSAILLVFAGPVTFRLSWNIDASHLLENYVFCSGSTVLWWRLWQLPLLPVFLYERHNVRMSCLLPL